MHTPISPADLHAKLLEIYVVRAECRHGLTRVNQQMHAVQAGALARSRGLPATQVVAALLHDIGHMLPGPDAHAAKSGQGGRHDVIAANWLQPFFGPAVTEPIRLHVAAKRYLCATEAAYAGRMSRDALESLARQGGPMDAAEVAKFQQEAWWRQAVELRRIDDAAHDPDGPLPMFGSFWLDIEAEVMTARRG